MKTESAETQVIRLWMMHGDAPVPLGGYAARDFIAAVRKGYYELTDSTRTDTYLLMPTRKLKKLVITLAGDEQC